MATPASPANPRTAPPQAQSAPPAATAYSWPLIASMALAHRRELIKANLIAIVGTLISVPIPLLIPLLVDEVLLEQPAEAVSLLNRLFPEAWHGPILYILAMLVLTLLLRLIALALGVWQMRQFTIISKDITFRIRRRLLQRLERISMAEYETLGSGTVASHLVTDIDAIDHFLGVSTGKLLVAVLSLCGTAAILLWMNWQLGLFILFLNPVVIWVTSLFGRKVKALKRKESGAYQAFQEALSETLDGIQQIRAANRERHYLLRITDKADEIRARSASFTWKSDAAQRLSFTIFLFGIDIFRTASMLMVIFSDLSIGQMLAVYAYLWYMMAPVQEILGMQYAFQAARSALDRINQLLAIREEPIYPHQTDPFAHQRTTHLEVRNVTFRYGDGPPVLNNISLHIQAGEKVALVGASGGGKTTLVQVILGLYTPQSGEILFDGVPTAKIGLDRVRDNVTTVLQHPALFNDTIRMNLTLGKEWSDEQLWQALEVAQLKPIVEEMPEGLETRVGRNGIRLSGGQRQRLAIARMVLSEPRIVVLDEATSALDTETERHLIDALNRFLEGRTTLIIAHRLSAVKQADRALVFEDGRIVESGSHDQLLDSGGLYASLYGGQEP